MATEQFNKTGRNDGRLYHAVKNGDRDAVFHELSQGDIDLTLQICGKSFLRLAGETGRRDIFHLLVQFGADPNEAAGPRKYSLLHNAVASTNFGFASSLLAAGAFPSPRCSSGATPLHFAARTGQEFLVTKLLKNKANINAQDDCGQTALHVAVKKGYVGSAKLLIQSRADVHLPDRQGVTPYKVAERLSKTVLNLLQVFPEL